MIDWYKKVIFENYANFSGRARRSEYWYYVLMNVIIFVFLGILCICLLPFLKSMSDFAVGILTVAAVCIFGLYVLGIIIPSLAVVVRRLHDIDKSGWYYFVRFIPMIGPIWLLVMLCTAGTQGRNDYGNDPKQRYDETDDIGVDSFNAE